MLLTVAARTPEVFLVLAGDGEDRRGLERHAQALGISERVVFLGRLPAGSVPELLDAADVFAQPSVYEGHSNALLEAMAAGLPILASDIPSQRETLTDDAGQLCGLLLPLDDSESWAKALQQLAKDPGARSKLGLAAADCSTAFTIERVAAAFEVAIVAARAGKRGVGHSSHERCH
jgi:glycosyltransferase involved in cell wall biosynthesis